MHGDNKVKILMTTPCLQLEGGVASFCSVLQNAFLDEICYFTIGRRDSRQKNILARVLQVLQDAYSLRKTIQSNDFKLIHLNPSLQRFSLLREALFLSIAKKLNRRVVVFFHGWEPTLAKRMKTWPWRLIANSYLKADAVIVLAREFQKELRSWGYKGIIYIGSTAVEDNVEPIQFEDRVKNSKSTFNVLFMARVTRSKGIFEALDAYHQVKQRYPHVSFVLAGDGEALEEAQCYVKQHMIKDVRFVGYVRGRQKDDILNQSDLLLLPTFHGEGLPMAIIEAMSYGLPIVTRSVGGLKDFFINGKMGFITDKRSPNDFADYLEQLIVNRSLRVQMGRFNQAYVEEHFTASKVAGKLHNIYSRVLNEQ